MKLITVSVYTIICAACVACSADPCEGRRCAVNETTFAPEAGLSDVVATAVEGFAAATGRLDIAISGDGIPVVFADSVLTADGAPACAGTFVDRMPGSSERWVQRIEVDVTPPSNCPKDVLATVEHEMIHAMNPTAAHTENGTLFGEFLGPDASAEIDEPSIAELCSGLDCWGME